MSICIAAAVVVLLLHNLLLSLSISFVSNLCQDQPDCWILVMAKHRFVNEAAIHLVDRYDHCLRVVLIQCKLANAKGS